MKERKIALATLVIIAITACAAPSVFEGKDFTLTYPSSWEINTEDENFVLTIYSPDTEALLVMERPLKEEAPESFLQRTQEVDRRLGATIGELHPFKSGELVGVSYIASWPDQRKRYIATEEYLFIAFTSLPGELEKAVAILDGWKFRGGN